MPKDPTATALSIAEIRLKIEGRSAPTHTLTVRGRTRPVYHFYKEKDTGIYHRRYVLGKTDPENGIFPLLEARAELEDIQRSATRAGGFKVIVSLLTAEELDAVAEAKAADEAARAKDQERQEAASLEASEPSHPAVAPKPAPKAAPSKKSAKPVGLAKLDALVGASA